ncbi:hypothetical protein [Mesotoga sp. B105.6.4]|uniref:hypothetical protein n=1 Tax=Mesotoga sp. B105.6.4 TaxID=1582224 RepID=UPI000CCE0458|nr:hypothetical protein [Mesotoga sp. B105.6.4]PNS35641.1 hypothetical protein RJ60_13800 [Mesotoga sp. B105.6.4]
MKGFDELRYIRPTLVIFIFVVTVLLMLLPYHVFQNEAISYSRRFTREFSRHLSRILLPLYQSVIFNGMRCITR